jgi:hypothetical protein
MLVGGLETREEPPAAGTWQGQPRSHRRTARGGAGPEALEAGQSGLACDGPAITCGGPGPPWGDRVRGGYPRALQLSWGRGGPDPGIARGGSGDHSPQLSGPDRTPRPPEGKGEITDSETPRA